MHFVARELRDVHSMMTISSLFAVTEGQQAHRPTGPKKRWRRERGKGIRRKKNTKNKTFMVL